MMAKEKKSDWHGLAFELGWDEFAGLASEVKMRKCEAELGFHGIFDMAWGLAAIQPARSAARLHPQRMDERRREAMPLRLLRNEAGAFQQYLDWFACVFRVKKEQE